MQGCDAVVQSDFIDCVVPGDWPHCPLDRGVFAICLLHGPDCIRAHFWFVCFRVFRGSNYSGSDTIYEYHAARGIRLARAGV